MRWVLYPIAALIALVILGLATLAAMALFAWPNLPALDTLTDYRPRVPLRVYTADGHLIGEFGEERRDVVRIAEVPSTLKHAILAAEDERFYEHKGIDPVGLARAALANLSSGGRGQWLLAWADRSASGQVMATSTFAASPDRTVPGI